jgi:hypothetical protein
MTHLTNNIYFVKIEGEVDKVTIFEQNDSFYYQLFRDGYWNMPYKLPEGKYSLIGTYHYPDQFDFDVEKFCKEEIGFVSEIKGYNEEIFLSYLYSKGEVFENEMGQHKPSRLAQSDGTLQTLDWQRNQWQLLQSQVEANRKATYVLIKQN